jgi:hypothetical protein
MGNNPDICLLTVRNTLYGINTKIRFCKGDISSNNTQLLPKATNSIFEEIFGAFLKNREKRTLVSSRMSVRRSASNNPTPTVQIFAKFYSESSH